MQEDKAGGNDSLTQGFLILRHLTVLFFGFPIVFQMWVGMRAFIWQASEAPGWVSLLVSSLFSALSLPPTLKASASLAVLQDG